MLLEFTLKIVLIGLWFFLIQFFLSMHLQISTLFEWAHVRACVFHAYTYIQLFFSSLSSFSNWMCVRRYQYVFNVHPVIFSFSCFSLSLSLSLSLLPLWVECVVDIIQDSLCVYACVFECMREIHSFECTCVCLCACVCVRSYALFNIGLNLFMNFFLLFGVMSSYQSGIFT